MSLSNSTNHPFEPNLSQTEPTQSKSATESLEKTLFGPITSPGEIVCGGGFDWIDIFDKPGNDILAGDASDDSLYGGSGNDSLKGNRGNDSLYGGSDNDSLFGGRGKDFLTGAADSLGLFGFGTSFVSAGIDRLTGGRGADTFVLGEASSLYNPGFTTFDGFSYSPETIFYSNDGINDYALVNDFNSTKDTVQLAGSATDYTLGTSPTGLPRGTAIYHGDPAGNEVIGVLQGVSVSDFSSGFTFVSSNYNYLTPDLLNPAISVQNPLLTTEPPIFTDLFLS